jgi:hypothetical protein
MTEEKWLSCVTPGLMLNFLNGEWGEIRRESVRRKIRLFACASGRNCIMTLCYVIRGRPMFSSERGSRDGRDLAGQETDDSDADG